MKTSTEFSLLLTKRVDTPENVIGSIIEIVEHKFPFYFKDNIGRKALVTNGMFKELKDVTEFRHLHVVSDLSFGKFGIGDIVINKKSQVSVCVSPDDMKWFKNRPEMISEYVLVHASTQAGEFNRRTDSLVPSISEKVLLGLSKSNFELDQFKNGVNALELRNMELTNLMYVGKVIEAKKVTDEEVEEAFNALADVIEDVVNKIQQEEEKRVLIETISFATKNSLPIDPMIIDKYNKLMTGE